MNPVNKATGSGAAGGGDDDNTNQRTGINQGRPSPAQASSNNGPEAVQSIKSIQAVAGGGITVPGGGKDIQVPDDGAGIPVGGGQSGGAADSSRRRWWQKRGFQLLPGMSRPHVSGPFNASEDPQAALRSRFQDVLPRQQQGDRIRGLVESSLGELYQVSNLSFVSANPAGEMRLHFEGKHDNGGYLQTKPDGSVAQRCIPGVQAFLTATTEAQREELESLLSTRGGSLTLDELSIAAGSVSGIDLFISRQPPLGVFVYEIKTVVRSTGLMVTGIDREGWLTRDTSSVRERVDVSGVIRQAMAMGSAAPVPSTRQKVKELGSRSGRPQPLPPGARPRPVISSPTNFQHCSTGGPYQRLQPQPQAQPQTQPQPQPQAASTGYTAAGQSAQGSGNKPSVAPKPKYTMIAGKPVLLPEPVATKAPAAAVGKPTPPPASAKPKVTMPGPGLLPGSLARPPAAGAIPKFTMAASTPEPSAPESGATGASPAPLPGADTLPQLESHGLLPAPTLLRPKPARLQAKSYNKQPPKKPPRHGKK